MSLDKLEEYGEEFITRLIGILLTDRAYLTQIVAGINIDDYENPSQKWIISTIMDYYKKYHTFPDVEFVRIQLRKFMSDNSTKSFVDNTGKLLKEAYDSTKDIAKQQFIKDEYSDFCKDKAIERACVSIMGLMGTKEYGSMRKLMEEAIKVGNYKEVGLHYEEDVEVRYREEEEMIVPTPLEEWNQRLDGGMRPGLYLVLGNSGGGKSWFVNFFGAYFRRTLGIDVLHYSAELREDYIGKRYDAYMLKRPIKEIKQHRPELEALLAQIKKKGRLTVRYINRRERTFTFIESNTEWLKSEGIDPKVIIIDYLDKFKMNINDKQSATIDLYDDVRDWAIENNYIVISPVQLGRSALRDTVAEGDKVAGYYEKLQIADAWWSLGRTKEHKKDKKAVVHWGKNRFGEDGMSDFMHFDAAIGEFEYIEEYVEEDTRNNQNTRRTTGNNVPSLPKKSGKELLKQAFDELESNGRI